MNAPVFSFSLYDLASLTTLIAGMTLALLLVFAKSIRQNANLTLGLALAVIVLKAGGLTGIPLLATGPLLFLHTRQLTHPQLRFTWKDLFHFFVLLIGFWTQTMLFLASFIIYLYLSHRLIEISYRQLQIVMMDRPRFAFRRLDTWLSILGICSMLLLVDDKFYLVLAFGLIGMAVDVILRPDMAGQATIRVSDRANSKERARRLKELVAAGRLYEDAELTLASLAEKLKIHPRELSGIINAGLDKNFNDFINEFRVREIIRRMQDPASDRFTIMGIAYQSGFNSKTTFNRVFKEITGKTPTEYKSSLKKGVPFHEMIPRSGLRPLSLFSEGAHNSISGKLNSYFMFKSYLKTAARNLWRNKFLSVIKILGLSLGLTVCLLIFLYSKDDISFDRFHANKENIFRVIQDLHIGTEPPNSMSITQPPLGQAFQTEIPEVKERVRLLDMPVTIKRGDDVFSEQPIAADDNFFSVFSFDLLKGDRQTVLKDMYSIVLTESAAKKYFGSTDAMGKIMQLKTRDAFENFTVTGIAANPPQNSTIRFDMLLPFEFYKKGLTRNGWIGGSLNTFLVLDAHSNLDAVVKKMQAIFDKNTSTQIAEAKKEQQMSIAIYMGLQPLADIHRNKKLGAFNGLTESTSPVYSYILSGIAIFILLIACINFINLSIGQSLKRATEIGIRKVIGGNRRQLIRQFLTESFVVTLIAFVLAVAITFFVLPFFNEVTDKKLSLTYLADGWLFAGWLALLLLTTFIAGFYPAVVLSSFKPLKVLSGRFKLMGKNYFSRALIVFQFALAIFLIVGTVAVYAQLNFLFRQDLGYNSENLVKIDLPFSGSNDQLVERFKKEVTDKKDIVSIAARNSGSMGSGVWADGKQIMIDFNNIDADFFPTFGIPLKQGRNFSAGFPADTIQSVIINETFVKQAGWQNKNPLGKTIQSVEDKKTYTIVGVIRDYHYNSLKSKIEAQVFTLGPAKNYGQLWVKINPANIPFALKELSDTYHKLSPLYPYAYNFMDLINARAYESETKWKQIITISSLLFIFISCMGLLGLVMLSVEQRTKEIGIRKVLGAAGVRIFLLISKDFVLLILLALALAVPAGYYAVDRWLQIFPYRISISWWIFGLAGTLIIVLALFTISFHAIRAAFANPVKSLRTE